MKPLNKIQNPERNELLDLVRADFVNTSRAELAKLLDVHLDNMTLTFGDERVLEYLKAKFNLEAVPAPSPLFRRVA
jgi:hypothetical protein